MVDVITTIFTGISMSMIGGGIFYTVTESGIIVEGKYKSKLKALFFVLMSIIIANFLFVPILNEFWASILPLFSIIGVGGILLIFTMIALNFMVDRWNYDDLTSIGIYILGALLVLIDYYSVY